MKALWDRYPELPYTATVPWPPVFVGDFWDWEGSAAVVDQWLKLHVGHRWVDWTWGWTTFAYPYWQSCTVNFRRPQSVTLFVLQYGCEPHSLRI